MPCRLQPERMATDAQDGAAATPRRSNPTSAMPLAGDLPAQAGRRRDARHRAQAHAGRSRGGSGGGRTRQRQDAAEPRQPRPLHARRHLAGVRRKKERAEPAKTEPSLAGMAAPKRRSSTSTSRSTPSSPTARSNRARARPTSTRSCAACATSAASRARNDDGDAAKSDFIAAARRAAQAAAAEAEI